MRGLFRVAAFAVTVAARDNEVQWRRNSHGGEYGSENDGKVEEAWSTLDAAAFPISSTQAEATWTAHTSSAESTSWVPTWTSASLWSSPSSVSSTWISQPAWSSPSVDNTVPTWSTPTSWSFDTQRVTKTEYATATVDMTVTTYGPSGTGASVCSAEHVPTPYSQAPQPPLPQPPVVQPSSPYPPTPFAPSPSCVLPSYPLSNEKQVGDSLWGTLCQPDFPQWLPREDGSPYLSAPWGDLTTSNSDPVVPQDVPVTNVTRRYDFTVTRGTLSADGVLRDVMLINNQFPGPAIEANWGDMIEVTVHNNISYPLEGTAIHWHGFLQRGSNWQDGVPSVSQCPIAPYHSFTYRIPAQLYGSSWYHAHYSAQYTAGLLGPIIVHGPSQLPYDIDIGPVMLSDWYHIPYFSIVSDAVGTDMSLIPPTSDSLLINGRGRFDCSKPSYDNSTDIVATGIRDDLQWSCVDGAELSKFKFQPGKVHRLRLMNVGADGVQKFSIDGHEMTVISYDYVPVKPMSLSTVTLGVGQRADVLVTANNYTTTRFWMRTSAPGGVTCGGSNMNEVKAAIYYEGCDTTVEPNTSSSVNDNSCDNLPLDTTEPEYPIQPSADPYVYDVALSLVLNATGHYEWRMNGQTFRANFNYPSLYLAAEGNTSYPYDPQWNVVNFGQNKSVVLNVTNNTPFTHPFHLHGHNFYVLGVGANGTVWDGNTVNPSNPMRRDVQIIPALGHAAIMFEADNPGVWPFHCHVAWHLSGGLAMNLVSRPDEIPTIPDGMRDDTCANWDFYSNNNVVDQIDAGS